MTTQEFHKRLLKLLKQAHKRGLCAGCVVREMLAASEAVSILAGLSSADLAEHGISMLEPVEKIQREHLH